jgi:hypothetical protein
MVAGLLRKDGMRLRATGLLNALCDREPAVPRPVSRQKRTVGTSHCAGASISYVVTRRDAGPYHFDRECFCLSPESHGAQFLEGVALPWLKGNA